MMSTRPKLQLSYEGLTSTLCGGLFGDGLVSDGLFCGGDSFEEDLRWGLRLGVFVDLSVLFILTAFYL